MEKKKIKARFICSLSLCYLDKKIACVRGKIEGTISKEPKGNNGFGYDPIFIPNGKKLTFGELSLKKNIEWIIDLMPLKKLKNFCKHTFFHLIKIQSMINFIIFYIKNSNFAFE